MFSSAKFEPNRIEVTERIGLDLVLPLSAMLPFKRHIGWIDHKQVGGAAAEELLGAAGNLAAMAATLIGKAKVGGPKGAIVTFLSSRVANAAISTASKLGSEQLRKMNAEAVAKKDYMKAVLTRFGLDLDDAEEGRVLLRSKK